MIIHEIDIRSIATVKREHDPPVSRYRNRPGPLAIPFELMQPKSRQIHPLRRCAGVQHRQYV